MRGSQRGVSVVEIILIVVVIGLIGAVAWLFVQNNNKSEQSASSTASTSSTEIKKEVENQATEAQPELSWFTYSPSGKQYSIKVPNGWTLHTKQGDDASLYSTGSLTIQNGVPGKVVNTVGELNNCGHFVLDLLPYANNESWPYQLVTDSGLSVAKSARKDDLDISGGGTNYSYSATSGQKTVYISYSTCGNGADNHTEVEKAIKTLSLN